MKIFTCIIIVIFSSLIFSQEDLINKSNEMVEVETKDGNILLGYIIDSDDNGFTLETKDGLKIMIPKSSVLRSSTLEIKDKVWEENKDSVDYLNKNFKIFWQRKRNSKENSNKIINISHPAIWIFAKIFIFNKKYFTI